MPCARLRLRRGGRVGHPGSSGIRGPLGGEVGWAEKCWQWCGSWLFCARRALVDAALPDDQTVGGQFGGESLATFLVRALSATDDRDGCSTGS